MRLQTFFQVVGAATIVGVVLMPDAVLAQGAPTVSTSMTGASRTPDRGRVFDVRPAAGEIRVDARLEEPAWREAESIPLPLEITPRDNVPADVETDCRVTFDERNLYLGCVALDPDPESIRAYITNRDGIFGNHDRISFLVDPFNDSRRGFVFEVSAVGVQADLVYDERTDFDESWDGIWHSAGRITDSGYVIEAAIPFRTLRFPSTSEPQTWRFWINRMRPRSELVVLRTNTRIRGESCQLCQAHLLHGFVGMDPGLNVELAPTLTGRHTASRAESFPDGPLAGGPLRLEPGLDARWSVASNLSLNATINPDFSQVEADAPQIDVNNAFALRFPEKRPFFLEGADLFATPMQVVFTRTITDPSAGVKLTGKSGPHAVGVLATIDEVNAVLLPGPFGSGAASIDERVRSTVVRYRRDIGDNGTVGAIYTGRFAEHDYRNQVGGLDLYVHATPTTTLSAQALASESRYDPEISAGHDQPEGRFSGQAAWTRLLHSGRTWIVDAVAEARTPGFRADAGFVPQTDYRGGFVFAGYNVRGDGRPFSIVQPGIGVSHGERLDGTLIAQGIWFTVNYEGPLQSVAWLNPEFRREAFDGETHELVAWWAGVDFRPLSWLRLGLSGSVGDQIDFRNGGKGDVVRFSPSFDAQLGRNVEIGARSSFQRLERQRLEVFTARVDELRGVVNLNARAFVRGILQYRITERTPDANPGLERTRDVALLGQFLASYKVNPLTVAFLGITDDRAGFEAPDGEEVALTPRGRSVFFKIGYAWRP